MHCPIPLLYVQFKWQIIINYIEYIVHGSKNGLLYDLTYFALVEKFIL